MVRPHILKKNQKGKFGFGISMERIQTCKVKLCVASVIIGRGVVGMHVTLGYPSLTVP